MSNIEKNKGGMKVWATPEQKAWLISNLPAYTASRLSKKKSDFWVGAFEYWFKEWPVGDSGEGAQKAKEKVSYSTLQNTGAHLSVSANQGVVQKPQQSQRIRWKRSTKAIGPKRQEEKETTPLASVFKDVLR
jgi:hypothetical protein